MIQFLYFLIFALRGPDSQTILYVCEKIQMVQSSMCQTQGLNSLDVFNSSQEVTSLIFELDMGN